MALSVVLNAFRHQRFDTTMILSTSAGNLVLNAFRHQRFDTSRFGELRLLLFRCSTPFGIRDSTPILIRVRRGKHSVLNAFRHQRFDTLFNLGDRFIPDVLNAFRHQRFDTFTMWTSFNLSNRAQRLSASEIRHSIRMMGSFLIQTGAQRLSASEIRHSITNNADPITSTCSTPFGIRDSTLTHALFCQQIQKCSTPFGIRDSTLSGKILAFQSCHCAQRLSASEIRHGDLAIAFKLSKNVLNAFRHQRFDTMSSC